jgi:RNA polymerase sigma-70 factor, ECF subfamily
MSENDDWVLVERAQAGDMDAFAQLVSRYQRPAVHFCYRMLASEQDAEDVAQEVFIRLHRYLKRLTPQAKFSTVLFGIAKNLCLNHIRDMKRRGRGMGVPLDSRPELISQARTPSHAAHLREVELEIDVALSNLSEDHRAILHLREIEGLDYEAIATILKCRKGTVKSRLARAREQLRIQLISQGGDLL